MIKIAALDDEKEWLELEKTITTAYFEESREKYKFETYSQADWFLEDLEKGRTFDIYLLDVELPESNGLKVARKIKQKYPEAKIIYITGYLEYAPEAFEINAFWYIPKKLLEEKLPEAYTALKEKLVPEAGPYYVIHTSSYLEKMEQKEIYYLMKDKKYVVFVKKDGMSRERTTLEDVYHALEQEKFVWIGKSHIANLRHIMTLQNGKVKMRDGNWLPVSKSQLACVKERIAQYWGKL